MIKVVVRVPHVI